MSELDKNDGKIEQNGANYTTTSSGRYDYSKDSVWSFKTTEIKEREKLLQSAYKAAVNGTQLITDDGEIVPVPEYKQSENQLK